MTLVDWGTICQSCLCDRLRLRCLQDQNKSFLLKLGVNLTFNQDALWVHMLCSKYGMKDIIPESIVKGSCSVLWRAITKIFPLQKENLC